MSKPKTYKYVEPAQTRQEMAKVLIKALERSLTDQEAKALYWLSDCEYETRGVILDLFKELASKIDD